MRLDPEIPPRDRIATKVFAGKPIIGIVGGIGSGKSFVAGLFGELGCLLPFRMSAANLDVDGELSLDERKLELFVQRTCLRDPTHRRPTVKNSPL